MVEGVIRTHTLDNLFVAAGVPLTTSSLVVVTDDPQTSDSPPHPAIRGVTTCPGFSWEPGWGVHYHP
jgi:hypothetical protein